MASSANWERLVRAALKRDQAGGLASVVPPSLGRTSNIEDILQAADDIEDGDPNVARILCEQAYTMARNLDPSSHGRGVLQFKTGLTSVVRQKLAKKDGASIDRENDTEVLWNFYLEYKSQRRFDDMQREQERMRESGTFSTEMGARTVEMKKIYATLRALLDVLKILVGQAPTDRLATQILEESISLADKEMPKAQEEMMIEESMKTTADDISKSPAEQENYAIMENKPIESEVPPASFMENTINEKSPVDDEENASKELHEDEMDTHTAQADKHEAISTNTRILLQILKNQTVHDAKLGQMDQILEQVCQEVLKLSKSSSSTAAPSSTYPKDGQ